MSSQPDPTITSVEPLKPKGLRVRVHLDEGDPLEVTLEAFERSGLGVGDRLPSNRRHHLLDEDADVQVREAALSLLSYRARTRTELARRLRQKGFRPARIDPCLDALEHKGLLDDEAVAAAFVRDRLRHRPRGRARLTSELRGKGVAQDVAEDAIARVFEDEDVSDAELASEVAEGWVARQGAKLLDALAREGRSPEAEKARRRLYGYLVRRGFRGDPLKRGMERAAELARDRVSG